MKLLFYALIVSLCCDICYGKVFDPYSRRYNLRNASFDGLFIPTPVASTGIQTLVNAQANIDNTRCRNIYQFTTTSTLDQLANFQHELVDLCPQLYETIRGKNFTTWGPVDEFLQIWYMKFIDALWQKIQVKTCRCQLYDDLVNGATAASDAALHTFLEANYDPALCVINDQTMYKWHLFLQRPQIVNRAVTFIRAGEFSLAIIHEIAKDYLTEARYNSYLIGPPYPLITYMDAILSMTNYTLTQKSFIRQIYQNLNITFPTLDLAGRQNYLLMKLCESMDLSFANFATFNYIPLDPLDGITHYHLILYFSRKQFLLSKLQQYIPSSPVPPVTCPPITTTTTAPITTTTITSSTTTTPSTTTTSTTTIPTTTSTSTSTTTTTSSTSTTTTAPTCGDPINGQAAIYIENGVVLDDDDAFPKADPVGTCISSTGVITYYNGTTPALWLTSAGNIVFAGRWIRDTCATPCVCTATACYTPDPGNPSPVPFIFLYPHCITPDNCYIALTFSTPGAIVNPLDPTDQYDFVSQDSSGDVTDPVFPRVNRIGCNSCPFTTIPPPTCTTTPPNSAAIYVEDGVVLDDDYSFPKADPVGSCINSTKGITFYNGETSAVWLDSTQKKVFVGRWLRFTCETPCVCTATACYTPQPPPLGGPSEPIIFLYPHCITPDSCFVTLIFSSPGSIVNPSNPADEYSSAAQEASGSGDVTNPAFPRITKIGCSSCPLTI